MRTNVDVKAKNPPSILIAFGGMVILLGESGQGFLLVALGVLLQLTYLQGRGRRTW